MCYLFFVQLFISLALISATQINFIIIIIILLAQHMMIICVSFWNAAVICNSPVYTLFPDDTSYHSENLHKEKGGGSNPSPVFSNWDICEQTLAAGPSSCPSSCFPWKCHVMKHFSMWFKWATLKWVWWFHLHPRAALTSLCLLKGDLWAWILAQISSRWCTETFLVQLELSHTSSLTLSLRITQD